MRSGLDLDKTSFNISEENVTCEAIVNTNENRIPEEIGWFNDGMARLEIKSTLNVLTPTMRNMTSTFRWNALNEKFYKTNSSMSLRCCVLLSNVPKCTSLVSIKSPSLNIYHKEVISKSTQSNYTFNLMQVSSSLNFLLFK